MPDAQATLLARLSAVVALGGLGMETVSYGSENDGELFVNLVVLSGDGRLPEKSRSAMRGRTDAVTFPFRGTSDQVNPEIAPSPDVVCLVGLRNPDAVGTTVMPMVEALPNLTAQQIHELKQPQFDIRAQKTFIPGMQLVLGEEQGVEGGEILREVDDQTWVRYSHSSVLTEGLPPAAAAANAAFAAACHQCATAVTIEPSDILLVSNRLALHGRNEVGGEPGGESRWLLRTYGLDTTG